jgi:DNA-binding SARP family transcriptional activator
MMGDFDGARAITGTPVTGAARPGEPVVARIFGPLEVAVGKRRLGARDFGGIKPRKIFEILLAHRGRPVAKEALAEALWTGGLPRNVAATLETYVSVLRRHLDPGGRLGHELIVTEHEAYRLDARLVRTDLDEFDALLARAADADTDSGARLYLERALAVADGTLFEGEPYASWAEEARDLVRDRRCKARLQAAESAMAEGDLDASLAHALVAIEHDEYDERGYRMAMVALYGLGRQKEGLELFHCCRSKLDDELGIEPTHETKALFTSILRQDAVDTLLPKRRRDHRERSYPSVVMPLIARTRELDFLDRVLATATAGNFMVTLVAGEEGVGKSRILAEVQARALDMRIGHARCSANDCDLPYAPLALALRQALAGVPFDPRSIPALCQVLPELSLDIEAPAFSQIAGLEALVRVLEDHAPMLLLLDDVHWADQQTIDALEYLQRRCDQLPVAVIATYRAEEVPPGHGLRHLARNAAALALEPLSPADVASLGCEALYEQTSGNPRLIVAALADGGLTQPSPSVTELILDRCRDFGPATYRLLATAAALPQPFAAEVLADLVGADLEELVVELERLCLSRLLIPVDDCFAFRYSLTRETLRKRVSPARRRLMVERALAALVQNGSEGEELVRYENELEAA